MFRLKHEQSEDEWMAECCTMVLFCFPGWHAIGKEDIQETVWSRHHRGYQEQAPSNTEMSPRTRL